MEEMFSSQTISSLKGLLGMEEDTNYEALIRTLHFIDQEKKSFIIKKSLDTQTKKYFHSYRETLKRPLNKLNEVYIILLASPLGFRARGLLFSFDIRLIPVLVNVIPSSTRPRVNNAPFRIGTRAWRKHMMINGIMPGTRI